MTDPRDRNHEFDDRDRKIHEGNEALIARMTANRDQLEAFHRDAKGRRKAVYEQRLASADKNLFEFRSGHEVFTEHLIAGGVLPESKRGRPVLENDTRTNAEKMGISPDSPVLAGLHQGNQPAGGRAKSLPAVPAPGQPASRLNPVVVDRSEQVTHEEAAKGPRAKSLPLNMPPGMIQGIPPTIMNPGTEDESEQTVAGAAAQGFAGGALAGAQMNLAERVSAQGPDDGTGKAPVRNADGQSLADLTAPAPGEDPLPGTSQPLAVDVLDAVQGIPPRRLAKGVARAVVMNPDHVAGLKELEGQQDDGLESEGTHYGR
jgi:hypothetical protein